MDYIKLTEFYESLEKTTKRLEKTFIISEFIKQITDSELEPALNLMQGRVFSRTEEKKIGVSTQLIQKALNKSTGESREKIEKLWIKTGDLGLVAEQVSSSKTQTTLRSAKLTIEKVYTNIKKLADLEGSGTVENKMSLIAELLTSANPNEAKYIVRTILEELRVGAASGTMRDAILWAFFSKELDIKYDDKSNDFQVEDREKYNTYAEIIQHTYDLTNDFIEIIRKIKKHGIDVLKETELSDKPINVMLYQKAQDIDDAFSIVGKPCAFEYKYDGFRLLIIKSKFIKLYTRRLENVTNQFPDIVEFVSENVNGENYILDAEVIGIDSKTGKWLPFQSISQRIKRKYNIEEIVKKIPVMVNVFDILKYNNKNLLNEPFKNRREIIEKIIKPRKNKIQPANQIVTDSKKTAEAFYAKALRLGNEGIMAKNLNEIYKPGSRVGYGVKIKPILEPLDLVITKAVWGEGKRSNWFSSFTIACRNGDNFLEMGKVGTGIKELEGEGVTFEELTNLLKPLIKKQQGKTVYLKPKIIVEVAYEEIQDSPTYTSGFALRFPRVLRLRDDKPLSEISDIRYVKHIYEKQRERNK